MAATVMIDAGYAELAKFEISSSQRPYHTSKPPFFCTTGAPAEDGSYPSFVRNRWPRGLLVRRPAAHILCRSLWRLGFREDPVATTQRCAAAGLIFFVPQPQLRPRASLLRRVCTHSGEGTQLVKKKRRRRAPVA